MRTRDISMCALLVVGGCAQRQHAHEASAREYPAHPAGSERASAEVLEREPATREGTQAVSSDDLGAPRPGVPADNTEINERDRDSASLTPMDQSENEADRDLLQRVRKAVIADDSLSFDAKNIKIITRDGQVTLRGAVANAREKATLEKTARDAAGTKRVNNQLEIAN